MIISWPIVICINLNFRVSFKNNFNIYKKYLHYLIFILYFCNINDLSRNNMNDDIFEDLLSDEGATGMVDPMTGESFNPIEDFEQFQNSSESTRITKESDSGYKELPTNLLDDPKDEENQIKSEPVNDALLLDFLKSKGINPDSIKVQDEDSEEIKELKFSELTDAEKLELLKYNSDEADDFEEHEIEAIEFLRENDMTLEELVKAVKEKTIAELQENQQEKVYQVDDFTDDELFIVDFKNKYGEDFTEEELEDALNRAKSNEDLYSKQMNKVRENFKEYEEQAKLQEQQQQKAEQEQQKQEYISQVVQVARSLNDMHDTVDLDDDDKEEILSFMFDELATGGTALDKALKDPATRYKVAWYIKNGDEVFNEVHNYYKSEINKLSKSLKNTSKPKPDAFIKDVKKQHTTRKGPMKLEELLN